MWDTLHDGDKAPLIAIYAPQSPRTTPAAERLVAQKASTCALDASSTDIHLNALRYMIVGKKKTMGVVTRPPVKIDKHHDE
jgi:hypothetical protein